MRPMRARDAYLLWGWDISYFTGKIRAYLRYKAIPFVERPVDLFTFAVRIKRRTGAAVMPVVVTPEGEWLQDTKDIVARLEERFPDAPVVPSTPRQRWVAQLVELWGDEAWLPSAMHYRWSFDANWPRFEAEAGASLLPHVPRALQRRAARKAGDAMRAHLPALGVTAAQIPAIEGWTERMLDALDAHFARAPFLLGTRPSIGDFGLFGPLYAHLGRDPVPRARLVETRAALAAWVARMDAPVPRSGAFLPNDEVPATLDPILRAIFDETYPYLAATRAAYARAASAKRPGAPLPRGLDEVTHPLGGALFRRRALPYGLWMAQRIADDVAALPPADADALRAWAAEKGGAEALGFTVAPRVRRVGLGVAAEHDRATR